MKHETLTLDTAKRSDALFTEHQQAIYRHTDRLFAWLMVFQWVGGIITAILVTPRTWVWQSSQIHIHVWAALLLGGALNLFPAWLGFFRPGKVSTRYIIACSQMLGRVVN